MLFDLIINRPKTAVFVFSIITLFLSMQALSLTITSDIEVYVPTEDPMVKTLMEMRKEWAMDSIIIYVEAENITCPNVLKEILAVETALNSQYGKQEGIIYTISIASFIQELTERLPFFKKGEIPEKQEEINFLLRYVPNEIKNLFIGKQHTSAVIIVAVAADADYEVVIENITRPLIQKTDETKMTMTGIVALYKETIDWTTERILIIFPLSLFLISLVIFFFTRNIKAVIISIFTVIFAIALTFGTIGLLPLQFTPQIVTVIPFLAALGVPYSLYFINHFGEEVVKRTPKAALKKIISTTGRAVFLSAITTIVGFVSLVTSVMPPVANLGFAFLIGITYCFIATMVLVPSFLLIFKYRQTNKGAQEWKILSKIPDYRKEILFIFLVITLLSIFVIPRISTEASIWEMMPKDMDSAKAMDKYSKAMGSGQMGAFYLGVETGDVIEPAVLKKIDTLEKIINYNIKNVSAYSIVDVIKSLNFKNRGNLPDTREEVEDIIDKWVSEDILKIMLSEDKTKALVTVNIPAMSVDDTKKPVGEIDELLDQTRETFPGDISLFTGMAPIFLVINNFLMGSQLQFTAISLALVFLCLLIVFRSLRYAIFTIIPLCFIMAWEPGLLVLTGVSLNVGTIMVSSIAAGAGIDFSIHITQRVQDELPGKPTLEAIRRAVSIKSISMIESTAALVAGGIPILLMNYQLISQFVIITLTMLVFAVMAAILGLTSIYSIKDGKWLEKWSK